MEFEIKLTDKDMYRFNMYQMYSGFHGWLSVILAVFVFVVGGVTYGEVETSRTVLYVVFGILFLIYPPLSLWLAAGDTSLSGGRERLYGIAERRERRASVEIYLQDGGDKEQRAGVQQSEKCIRHPESAAWRAVWRSGEARE